jgi:hypothetical protein
MVQARLQGAQAAIVPLICKKFFEIDREFFNFGKYI